MTVREMARSANRVAEWLGSVLLAEQPLVVVLHVHHKVGCGHNLQR